MYRLSRGGKESDPLEAAATGARPQGRTVLDRELMKDDAKHRAAGKKAAATEKSRTAEQTRGQKAAATKKRNAAGKKAAATKSRRAAGAGEEE